jgi:hypothetical protein
MRNPPNTANPDHQIDARRYPFVPAKAGMNGETLHRPRPASDDYGGV